MRAKTGKATHPVVVTLYQTNARRRKTTNTQRARPIAQQPRARAPHSQTHTHTHTTHTHSNAHSLARTYPFPAKVSAKEAVTRWRASCSQGYSVRTSKPGVASAATGSDKKSRLAAATPLENAAWENGGVQERMGVQ